MGGPCRILSPEGRWVAVRSTDNFAHYPMTIRGQVWPTVEHYFQAMKFIPLASQGNAAAKRLVQRIRVARSPGQAWALGQNRTVKIRRDWEQVKASVMLSAVRFKYDQHEELAQQLVQLQGEVKAPMSTANWQVINGMIIERVREELSRKRGITTDVSPRRFEELVKKTDPQGT
eukprot:g545.t1